MCKYDNILRGNHDGEETDYEKLYKNDTTNDTSSTTLKCWLKFSAKINFRCLMVSKLAYVLKVF